MTIFCKTCNVLREFRVDDFFKTKKERVVCGVCKTVLSTRQEIEDYLEYEYMKDSYWEV